MARPEPIQSYKIYLYKLYYFYKFAAIMLKAYKYRIYPTEDQKVMLSGFFGSVRFIYNLALETKIAAWTSAQKNLTCLDLCYQLPELKKEYAWLAECPAQSLQYSLRNLDNAYTRFFKGGGFPKFKRKTSAASIQFPQGVRVESTKVFIPKLKWIDIIQHRPLLISGIKTTTISKTATDKYFISILVDNGAKEPKKKKITAKTTVGIDVGLKTFATLSDGDQFENQKHAQKQAKRLRVEQRKLARKFKKGAKEQSKGYHKQKLIVATIHEKIANQRKDFLHKASTSIVKKYDTICLEDLNVAGMIKNRRLSKSISDVSWPEFMRMLEYKAAWHGKNIITIGRFDPSSKICSNCGTINKELTLSDREWICSKCNTNHDRDKNAAINIKNFGLRNEALGVKTKQ